MIQPGKLHAKVSLIVKKISRKAREERKEAGLYSALRPLRSFA
jgi:hypothetical protein